jgi:hypothetical protein
VYRRTPTGRGGPEGASESVKASPDQPSPYYRADDPRSAAHIDKHFKSALANYKDISYEQLHEYLTELLTAWYEENPPAASSKRRVSLLEEGEV